MSSRWTLLHLIQSLQNQVFTATWWQDWWCAPKQWDQPCGTTAKWLFSSKIHLLQISSSTLKIDSSYRTSVWPTQPSIRRIWQDVHFYPWCCCTDCLEESKKVKKWFSYYYNDKILFKSNDGMSSYICSFFFRLPCNCILIPGKCLEFNLWISYSSVFVVFLISFTGIDVINEFTFKPFWKRKK